MLGVIATGTKLEESKTDAAPNANSSDKENQADNTQEVVKTKFDGTNAAADMHKEIEQLKTELIKTKSENVKLRIQNVQKGNSGLKAKSKMLQGYKDHVEQLQQQIDSKLQTGVLDLVRKATQQVQDPKKDG